MLHIGTSSSCSHGSKAPKNISYQARMFITNWNILHFIYLLSFFFCNCSVESSEIDLTDFQEDDDQDPASVQGEAQQEPTDSGVIPGNAGMLVYNIT